MQTSVRWNYSMNNVLVDLTMESPLIQHQLGLHLYWTVAVGCGCVLSADFRHCERDTDTHRHTRTHTSSHERKSWKVSLQMLCSTLRMAGDKHTFSRFSFRLTRLSSPHESTVHFLLMAQTILPLQPALLTPTKQRCEVGNCITQMSSGNTDRYFNTEL